VNDVLDDALSRIVFALEAGRPIPPELAQWLNRGFRRYRAGGIALDDALGLDRLSRAERIQRRDAILREIATLLPPRQPAEIARQIATGRALPDPAKILRNQAARIAPIPKNRQLLRIIAS